VARGSRLMAAVFTGLALVVVAGSSTSVGAPPGPRLGVYVGAHNPGGVRQFEKWLGRDVQYVLDFVPADSWRTIESPGALRKWRSPKDRLVLGVPLMPSKEGGSLEAGATGAYNAHFKRLARNLARWGRKDAILRLGWEFSGGWYPWSVQSDEDAVAFAAYWRQIVHTMRGVSKSLKFDWNPAHGWRPFDIDLAYPGNAYVDYIGLDIYDQGWQPEGTTRQERWLDQVRGEGGLAWHRAFAKEHKKPMSFPEWGLAIREDGQGGGDNALFIERMYNWISHNPVAYHIYFNFDAPDGRHELLTGQFPIGSEVFKKRFGSVAPLPND
jgi:glycosyl hydrolase family 26